MKNLLQRGGRLAARCLSGTGLERIPLVRQFSQRFKRLIRADAVEVNGYTLYLDRLDSLGLSLLGRFEPFETQVIRELLSPGDVAVDVGANIGYYTLLMAQCVGSEGEVHAFEPAPENFALLERNVQENSAVQVTLEEAAVGDCTGRIVFFESRTDLSDHRTYETTETRIKYEVPCFSLDGYCAGKPGLAERIDLIKMDIQGAEFHALQGMMELLRTNRKLKLVTEFWPHGFESCQLAPEDFLSQLEEHGFRLREIREQDACLIDTSAEKLLAEYTHSNQNFTNLLCER